MHLAVLMLPRGRTRERYRDEFLAELAGLPPHRHRRHLLGLVVGMPMLGRVLRATSREAWADLVGPRPRRRLRCALDVRHVWRTFSTEDGGRYRACLLCEKDYPVRDGRVGDGPNAGHGVWAG